MGFTGAFVVRIIVAGNPRTVGVGFALRPESHAACRLIGPGINPCKAARAIRAPAAQTGCGGHGIGDFYRHFLIARKRRVRRQRQLIVFMRERHILAVDFAGFDFQIIAGIQNHRRQRVAQGRQRVRDDAMRRMVFGIDIENQFQMPHMVITDADCMDGGGDLVVAPGILAALRPAPASWVSAG